MRYYVAMLKEHKLQRECDPVCGPERDCPHRKWVELETWKPWRAHHASTLSVYGTAGRAGAQIKRQQSRAVRMQRNYNRNAEHYGGRVTTLPGPSPVIGKVAYFETDDLLEVTEDEQFAFEQTEAKMLRVADKADQMQKKLHA